jgi:TolB protein
MQNAELSLRTVRRLLQFIILVLVLVGCASANEAGPAAPAELRGAALPGRLLFVADGAIWQWQGREARRLITAGDPTQPAFAPDGERIAYVTRSNSASDLVVADRNGRELARLTANEPAAPPNSLERVTASRWALYPAWSPDGEQLVVTSQAAPPVGDPPAEYNLALYSLDVGPAAQLTPLYADAGAHCGRSVFAPDGSLVFVRSALTDDGAQQLYRLDPQLGTSTPLPGAPTPSYDPAFSADGAWLAFAAHSSAGTDIFALPGSGGAAQQLTTMGSARAPAFAPDGGQMAFLAIAPGESGFDLWVSDLTRTENGGLSAGTPRRLTSGRNLDADAGLTWAP